MTTPKDKGLLASDEEIAASLDDRSHEIARKRLVGDARVSEAVNAAREVAAKVEEPKPARASERVEAASGFPVGAGAGRVETTGKVKYKDPRSATTEVVKRPTDPRQRLLWALIAIGAVALVAVAAVVIFRATSGGGVSMVDGTASATASNLRATQAQGTMTAAPGSTSPPSAESLATPSPSAPAPSATGASTTATAATASASASSPASASAPRGTMSSPAPKGSTMIWHPEDAP